jgi:multidrug efflux pump subunit AcrA (membrane-fusion protein)
MGFLRNATFHGFISAMGYVLLVAILLAAGLGYAFADRWAPRALAWLATESKKADEPAHGDADSLELSEQAQKHLGLKPLVVKLEPFERTISIPGIVVERPGSSSVEVPAPMAGIVTDIHVGEGAAVQPEHRSSGSKPEPGQLLFELRLTHEELVQVQGDFLNTVEQLAVVDQEIKRLEASAVQIQGQDVQPFAGKTLLTQKYEKQKLEATLRAQRQRLELHGFSVDQIEDIQKSRQLRRRMQVRTPPNPNDPQGASPRKLWVTKLKVRPGQHVDAGESLATLVDYSDLLIEGKAFEQDAPRIAGAMQQHRLVKALFESEPGKPREKLEIEYLSTEVDRESRAFHFYVRLPNEPLRSAPSPANKEKLTSSDSGQGTVVGWRYKPGQRVDVLVPVEQWTNRIVLPIDAVVRDGAEWYVFRQNGEKHFDRQPVHVEYHDQRWVVVANDGSLSPAIVRADGSVEPQDIVAGSGAYQMLLALKNKSGGGADPHAGHSH